MNTKKKIALVLIAALGASSTANALPFIQGSIGFSGSASTWAFDGTCTNVGNCNGFTLAPAAPANNIEVDVVSGDFNQAGSTLNSIGTMKAVSVGSLPVPAQWTMGIFTFDLLNASIDTVINGSFKFLNMQGNGFAKAAGYEDTFGVWSWTGTATGQSFTFAPTTTVPEPTSLALLGVALAGIGIARRRKAAVQA